MLLYEFKFISLKYPHPPPTLNQNSPSYSERNIVIPNTHQPQTKIPLLLEGVAAEG
jgi:hypothetical protein